MVIGSRSSLSIYSETHTAAEVTELLELQPTRSNEKGDPHGRPRPNRDGEVVQRVHKNSFWDLEATSDKEDSFSSLQNLIEIFRPKAAYLAKLRENYTTRIWWAGDSNSTKGGFVFPEEILAGLAELGCELFGDVWLESKHADGLVHEHAILTIKLGEEAEFESAFDTASNLLYSLDGFREVTLSRGVEKPSEYLLIIRWDSVEDHEIGFRGSPEYEEWKALLHHFYEPIPTVKHFVEVLRSTDR